MSLLREAVIAKLQDSPWRVFLEPGNGDFPEGQFNKGLGLADPTGTLQFEELLIKLRSPILCKEENLRLDGLVSDCLKDSCSRLFWQKQDSISALPDCYLHFASWVYGWYRPAPRNAVVTFNWDLVVEKAMNRGWGYCAGDQRKVPVLKPHGSINWSRHLRKGLRAEYNYWASIGPGNKLCYDAREPLANPDRDGIHPDLRYMIFPGDPDLPGEDPDLKLIWDDVATVISESDTIVFIGYSLPQYDSFAASFFAEAAAGRQVEVYNPSREALSRYERLFGKHASLNRVAFENCPYAARDPAWIPRRSL